MSSKQSGFVDDWQNGKSLPECNLYMLTSEDSCDVTFVVGENEAMVTAHRYVLMSRSCVFHAMLRGPFAEREKVKVPDVPELIFRDFLRFLYTDSVAVTPDNVTGLLYLGKKYSVGILEKVCLTNLETSLSADSACTILEQAHRFDEADLMSRALDVIVENSEAAKMSQEFSGLCNICVDKVIRSEQIDADPKLIFTAALAWASEECKRQKREITPKNQREALGDSIYYIGFPSMEAQIFSEVVVPTKILSDEEHTKIFCYLISKNTDVAPFKSREMPPVQSNVLFYKDLVQAPEDEKLNERIYISCYRDVSIKGLLVNKSKHQHGLTYELLHAKVGCSLKSVPIRSVSFIGKLCLEVFTLEQHLTLKAGVEYGIEVAAKTDRPYLIRTEQTAPIQVLHGKENIRFDLQHYQGSEGVIAGLVLADQ